MLSRARLLAGLNVLARLNLVALALCATISAALANPLESALKRFAEDSFAETALAIEALSGANDPKAAILLEALADRRLFVSAAAKQIVFQDSSGAIYAASSGAKLASPPTDLSPVRINNRLRGAINDAMGRLSLLSPEPERRKAAAEAVFRARGGHSLTLIETALSAEQDPAIRRLQREARAAIILTEAGMSTPERLEAIGILMARGDRDALTPLRLLPADAGAEARAAAQTAIREIEGRLALWANVQNVWYGLSLGSILLLAAIGLAITFGVMGVINMAHGEMVMIGAYTTFLVQEIIRQNAPHLFDFSLLIAIPLAFLGAGLVGIAIERGVIRFLYGRPLETLLATWGISLILQQSVRTLFGSSNREVGAPAFMAGSFKLGVLEITYGRVWIVGFAALVFLSVLAVLRFTPLGLHMRAVTQNRRMAAAMGIRTGRIDALTFGLGSGIAGLAGVALSQIDNVSPNLGQSYIIDSFMVVVFGGVGNLWGTLVAALSLGIANKFLEPLVGAVLGKIVLLIFIILFIQKRPRGLFALKGRAVEP